MKNDNKKISMFSKIFVLFGIISMISSNVVAYAGTNNQDAYWFDFQYQENGIAVNEYSQWAQKDTTGPVRAVCQSATSSFSVWLVGCVNDTDSASSSIRVSGTYYMGSGTSCDIVNTALSQQPNRAWVALRGLYQGDDWFRAYGLYVPN